MIQSVKTWGIKPFLKVFLSLWLCFCAISAQAIPHQLEVKKNNGILHNFFQKTLKIGHSYKTQLEIKYYEDLIKKNPKDIEVLKTYAKFLEDNGYYKRSIDIYNELVKLTKNKDYNKDIIRVRSAKNYYKNNKTFTDYIKQAQDYESKGKIIEANRYYQKAQKIFPKRFEAMFGLAKTYGWLGKPKLANQYYQSLIKIAPNNPDLTAAYNKFSKENKQIQSYKNPQIPKRNKNFLKKITKTSPKRLQIVNKPPMKMKEQIADIKTNLIKDYIKQAQDYEQQGKIKEANEYYLKAENIDSSRFEVKFGLAKTFGWLHNDKLALKYYKQLLNQSPNNFDLLEAYASFLKDTKNYKDSMKIYQYLFMQTRDEKYNSNIAEIYLFQGDYKTAMNIYKDIYEKDPLNLNTQKSIAYLYFLTGNFNKSIEFYEKYLSKKQDPDSILNYTKSLFYGKRKIEKAKEILETYIKVYPKNAEAFNTLAEIYLSEKDLNSARNLVTTAINLEPNNVKYRIQYAKIDIAAKYYIQAKNILLSLLKIEPDNPDIWENLGDISYYTADFPRAIKYYQRIPNYKNNKRIQFKIAQSYHYNKNYVLAEKLYNSFVYDADYSSKAKIGIAEIRISQGEPIEARKILENVLVCDPRNIQAKKNLGITYYSTGDNYKSIKILRELPQDDSDISYNLAKAYNKIDRCDKVLELLKDNPQENAKALKGEVKMQIRPTIEPYYEAYYEAPSNGSANAGKYQKAGGIIYFNLKPNFKASITSLAAQYSNITNIVSTTAIINTLGLEGQINDHLNLKTSFGAEVFSNGNPVFLGSAIAKYTPNDFFSWTSGYIRSLDEIDSYMSAVGVIPSVGPFANQLVGRIVDNKYILFNIGLKLPYKMYAYGGMNVGNKYGSNSPSNFYKEMMWGFGKLLFSAAEDKPVNQVLLGYDFYYTGYNYDRSGFGGANLDFSPVGSDGQAIDPSSGFPGTGGYFSPTFFIANKFPLTLKGTFRETKLKYVISGYIGTQTIQGQIGLLGQTPGGASEFVTTPYYGYSISLRYNEKGRFGWGLDYTFNNYMRVAQHMLRAFFFMRF